MVILDTNVIIDHLRQPKIRQSSLLKIVRQQPKATLAISVISVQELYEGKSTQYEEKEQFLLATIAPLIMIPYTYEVAQRAGIIARDLAFTIEFADAAIAATAIVHQTSFFTLNKKHFAKIKNLNMINVE